MQLHSCSVAGVAGQQLLVWLLVCRERAYSDWCWAASHASLSCCVCVTVCVCRREKDMADPLKSRHPNPGMAAGAGKQGRIGTTGATLLTQHLLKLKVSQAVQCRAERGGGGYTGVHS